MNRIPVNLSAVIVCLILMVSVVLAATVSIQPVSISTAGETMDAVLILDAAPAGLSGYSLTITPDNPAVATITGCTFPAWASLSEGSASGTGYAIRAIDLNAGVEAGATGVALATLTIRGEAAGSTALSITASKVDDDSGNPVEIQGTVGTVTVGGGSEPPAPTAEPTSVPTSVPTTAVPTEIITPTPVPTLVPSPVPTNENSMTGEVIISLVTGWNFIGFSLQPAPGSDTAAIFGNVPSGGHSVLRYDPNTGWQTVGKDEPLTKMAAYWIYSTGSLSIPVQMAGAGSPKNYPAGWNTLAIPSATPVQADSILSPLTGWTYAIGFDAPSQQYRSAVIRGAGGDPAQTLLQPGFGYWVYLSSPGTLGV